MQKYNHLPKANKETLSLCFVSMNLYQVLSPENNHGFAGGAESQQAYIAREYICRGATVSAVCLDYGQDDAIDVGGVTIYKAYNEDKGLPVLRFIHPRLTQIWQALKRADADVYYQRTAGMLTGVVAHFCRHYKRIFVYNGAHDTDFQPNKELIKFARDRVIYRYGLRNADLVISQNMRQTELALHNYNLKTIQIPNCYPQPLANRSTQETSSANDILWVSTIREWKRPELFLAIARVFPEQHFVLVGGAGSDPTEQRLFQRIIEEATEINNLDIIGFVPPDKIDKYFDKARIFINTSVSEGFPNTFLQAWARGIVTISTFSLRVAGNGSPPGLYADTIEEIVEALGVLLSDEALRKQLSQECLDYYLRFHTVERVMDVLEESIRSAQSAKLR